MVRASRIFLATYAVLLAVLAVVAFTYIQSHLHFVELNDLLVSLQWWSESGAMAAAYLVLAAGLVLSGVSKQQPPWRWLVAASVLVASPMPFLGYFGDSPDPVPWVAVFDLLLFQVLAFCYVALLLWIARDLGRDPFPPGVQWRRVTAFLALPAGAVLVLLSPFLTVIARGFVLPWPEHKGWEILARREPWTLAISFAGQCNQSLWTWPWLSTAENMLGYVFYMAAIVASIALLIWLAKIRLSPRRAQGSLALPVFAAVFSFVLFWFSTEAFWALQEYAGAASWVTILAIALWLASPACLLILLVHAARGRRGVERWRMLMYLQTPVVAYLFVGYLPQKLLDFAPGLLALVAGLQLESLACIGLLAIPPADPLKPEAEAAPHATL